jgi:hypothetical protein
MNTKRIAFIPFLSVIAAVVAGCVTMPEGPGVLALPGSGKSFDQFRADDFECRQYASAQVGGNTANQAAVNSGVASAAVGTAVGALAGAAMDGGHGAAAGAGAGLLVGSAAGAGAGSASGYSLQQRYDFGYIQCMYAKGNKVPVSGRFMSAAPGAPSSLAPSAPPPSVPMAPPSSTPPPPPAGNPPPPPPR